MGVVKHLADYRPPLEVVEHRVAQLEDGFTRVANELLDAVMASGLSETEMCIVLAVWRKTYGFNKKWIGSVTSNWSRWLVSTTRIALLQKTC